MPYPITRWLAEQIGHRLGSLSLLATLAGIALLLTHKRPFIPLLATAFACSSLALLSSLLARRYQSTQSTGLIFFNFSLLLLTCAAMTLARLGVL